VAAQVPDPELPVLTLEDLGILREVTEDDRGRVHVRITPTYSGCPAVETIREDLVAVLTGAGYQQVVVELVLAPAWTTDWITPQGLSRLAEHGIAPPGPAPGSRPGSGSSSGPVPLAWGVRCPQCGSVSTRELSRFGSTACKALWVCRDCREPFDRFKPL